MADIFINIACKELKIAQIVQLNQLFQLWHLVHIYGHGFCELSRMLMRENVNNDVSKDSPIPISSSFPSTFHCNLICLTSIVIHNYVFTVSSIFFLSLKTSLSIIVKLYGFRMVIFQ